MSRRPSPELGERHFSCEFYSLCLNEASQNNWDSFSCNECPVFTGEPIADEDDLMEPGKDETVKLCEECADKPVISKGSKFCASCLARRASASKTRRGAKKKTKGKRPRGTPPKRQAAATQKQKARETGNNTLVQVDFKGYEDILDRLKQEALDQVRTLEGQIIWALKTNQSRP